jgi:hypothetical protein
LSEFGGRNRPSVEIQLEAVSERVCRYTGQPYSREFGDTLGGCDRASLEMHLVAIIEQVWRYTWRPYLGKIGDVLDGQN